jgi:hypothetical protein
VGDHAYQISIRIAKHEAYIHAASSKRYGIEKNHSQPHAPLIPPKKKTTTTTREKERRRTVHRKKENRTLHKKGLK